MANFDFAHHIREYDDPFVFAEIHDQAYIKASSAGIDSQNQHALLTSEYRSAIKCWIYS